MIRPQDGAGDTDDLARLLNAAIARLRSWRRTFTEEDALASLWDAGYEVSPAIDPRFVLARESDGNYPRQWRLAEQALANDRLLGELRAGQWDGRDLDTALARLDAVDHVHYVFCPLDPRFTRRADGMLAPADHEPTIALPASVAAVFNALGPALLECWRTSGSAPWTLRQVTETLGALGWSEAGERESWLLVRAWLLSWPQVVRVGADYWVPAEQVPRGPARTRLRVLPVYTATTHAEPATYLLPEVSSAPEDSKPAILSGMPAPMDVAMEPRGVSWTVPLRTAHVVEGFLPVPPPARSAYPQPQAGEGDTVVLSGRWFDTGERLWLWLDRAHDRLFGLELAHQLAWCEAGDLLHIAWTPEVVVLRLAGHDMEIQHEETRLVDVQALAELRGGLGESYRRSLQAILGGLPDGLPFKDIVAALRERQGHTVHRGTVRALLSTGVFIQHQGRWCAAPANETAARMLRVAIVTALVPEEQSDSFRQPSTSSQGLRTLAQAIQTRLSELSRTWRKMPSINT
jgi:hypothetical protein